MAKERMVNTRFWADGYISGLGPKEKLFFLYLLTNQYTEISGIYELPAKYMIADTGISEEEISNTLAKFEKDGKVIYRESWVYVINFARYQKDNPKVKKGIENALLRVPKRILDSLYIAYDSLSHLNSNLNSNSNLNLKGDRLSPTPPPPPISPKKLDYFEMIFHQFMLAEHLDTWREYVETKAGIGSPVTRNTAKADLEAFRDCSLEGISPPELLKAFQQSGNKGILYVAQNLREKKKNGTKNGKNNQAGGSNGNGRKAVGEFDISDDTEYTYENFGAGKQK